MAEDMIQYRGKVYKELLQQNGLSVAYDGDMKDGKPEGYGRAYYKDGRIFEGEWKNGQYDGEGRQYYDNLNLWYAGGFKNGKREGFGKSYYEDGTPAFEGEWKDGKPVK
ncbi:MAG TPA: hypothetical protein VN426_12405 [Syntrophomonadaceae bacterium]|nr:hypothetical protein [Syntrophomonadaceae bacterium]